MVAKTCVVHVWDFQGHCKFPEATKANAALKPQHCHNVVLLLRIFHCTKYNKPPHSGKKEAMLAQTNMSTYLHFLDI
jgi:hypothetical protein